MTTTDVEPVTYELEHVRDLNFYGIAPNRLVWLFVRFAHAATFDRWPARPGWILWRRTYNEYEYLEHATDMATDEDSCNEAISWASNVIYTFAPDNENPRTWTDRSTEQETRFTTTVQ